MSLRALIIITCVLALVYFGLLGQIRILGAVPNLVLIFVIVVTVEVKDLSFIPVALTGGLIMDLYLGAGVGTFTGALLAAGFLGYALFNGLRYGFSWKQQIVLVL